MRTNRRLATGVEKVMRGAYRPLLLVIGVSAGLVSVASRADVPNTFVDGTPAVAAEVNANFGNLDQRLENLESLKLADRLSDLESLDLPEVTVDCDAAPGALQAAIDAASPLGLSIQVSGSCDAVQILNKRNLLIDGGNKSSTTITASAERVALDIALSQGVFVSNLTAVGNDEESAVSVGASVAILSNVSAINGPLDGDGTVSVQTGGYAIFGGDTAIGSNDGSDTVALRLSERGSVLIEGVAVIKGITAINMAQQSLFDQDPDSSADTLGIEGNVLINTLSTFEMNNGFIDGNAINIVSGSRFVAIAEVGFNIGIDGGVLNASGGFVVGTASGGTASFTGTYTSNFGGAASFNGAGTVLAAETVNLTNADRLVIQGGTAIGNGEIDPVFNVDAFSILRSFSEIDPAQVTCSGAVAVIATQLAPSFVNLCL